MRVTNFVNAVLVLEIASATLAAQVEAGVSTRSIGTASTESSGGTGPRPLPPRIASERRYGWSVSKYGTESSGPDGALRLHVQLGEPHRAVIQGGPAGSPVALVVGTSAAQLPLGNEVVLWVQPVAILAAQLDSAGSFSTTFRLDPASSPGTRIHLQAFALDPREAAGLAPLASAVVLVERVQGPFGQDDPRYEGPPIEANLRKVTTSEGAPPFVHVTAMALTPSPGWSLTIDRVIYWQDRTDVMMTLSSPSMLGPAAIPAPVHAGLNLGTQPGDPVRVLVSKIRQGVLYLIPPRHEVAAILNCR